jgi:hypothetical protein
MKDNKNFRMIPDSVEVNFNIIVAFFVVVVTTSVSTSLSSFNVTMTVLLVLSRQLIARRLPLTSQAV